MIPFSKYQTPGVGGVVIMLRKMAIYFILSFNNMTKDILMFLFCVNAQIMWNYFSHTWLQVILEMHVVIRILS